ncbi:hypothetical protein [Sinorhizobium psoraleae]|uniref:Uncharacterized protein n=1 Tax=Sinorhizobium psoraleae TaxID=520838 RepID=A0ABT4KFI3_9HYPH|nr:hypothetical protein [Sinorhizobium psoraleae]MCZ4090613.1 hypothetical protein [Sinorhizobium psoraleae]
MADRNLTTNSKNRKANEQRNVVYCTFEDMKQLVQKETTSDRPVFIIRHPNDGGSATWQAPSHCKWVVLDLDNKVDVAVAEGVNTAFPRARLFSRQMLIEI